MDGEAGEWPTKIKGMDKCFPYYLLLNKGIGGEVVNAYIMANQETGIIR